MVVGLFVPGLVFLFTLTKFEWRLKEEDLGLEFLLNILHIFLD